MPNHISKLKERKVLKELKKDKDIALAVAKIVVTGMFLVKYLAMNMPYLKHSKLVLHIIFICEIYIIRQHEYGDEFN